MQTKTVLACIAALTISFASSQPQPAWSAAPEPIKIGSILILTGEGASWGTASKNGMELAIERLNAEGGLLGRQVEAVHQDDQGDPKKTIAAFRQLTDVEGVRLIIGPSWSNLGLPLIDMAARGKVLMISPTLGMAKFNESSAFLFNTWPHDYIASQKLAEQVFNDGHRRVALVGAEHVWVKEQTVAFQNRFEQLGGKITFLTEPLPGTTDVRNEALKIRDSNSDAIVSTTDGVIVGSLIAKSLKDLNVKLPLYSILLDQSAIDAAQGGFEGLVFLTFLTPTPEFKKIYEERFKTPINPGADSAYDAVMMLAEAIRKTGSTEATRVAANLAEVKEYQGVSGHLISDAKRGFTKQSALKKVVGGVPVDFE